MAWARNIQLADGRRLRVQASAEPGAAHRIALVWHHGSPQTGALLEPHVSVLNAVPVAMDWFLEGRDG